MKGGCKEALVRPACTDVRKGRKRPKDQASPEPAGLIRRASPSQPGSQWQDTRRTTRNCVHNGTPHHSAVSAVHYLMSNSRPRGPHMACTTIILSPNQWMVMGDTIPLYGRCHRDGPTMERYLKWTDWGMLYGSLLIMETPKWLIGNKALYPVCNTISYLDFHSFIS